MAKGPKDDDKQPIIIIKKVKKVAGGHHGGAWKVAYADFVTAMMAFFLLLWLLNVTTDEQKSLISSYFSPADPRIAESLSGAGGVMGGQTMSDVGAQTDDQVPPAASVGTPSAGSGKEDGSAGEDGITAEMTAADKAKLDAEDDKAFKKLEEELKQAIEKSPELAALKQNLIVDMTPEGLRIQIVDQEGKPMFPSGSYIPFPEAVALMQTVAKTIATVPNKISMRGHTDSKPYSRGATYTNWELSSDRANASRRIMTEKYLPLERIENVQGKADREHLVVADPLSARNRRITIILLKQSIVPAMGKEKSAAHHKPVRKAPEVRRREEGVIYFP